MCFRRSPQPLKPIERGAGVARLKPCPFKAEAPGLRLAPFDIADDCCRGELKWHMLRKVRLFTPGPTPLLPAAQFAMAAADLHHRTPELLAIYSLVLQQLKEFIGTQNDVVLLTASGTGAMEAAVSNLTSPGEKVLVLSAGKFGERWTGLANSFGCNPVVVSAPYGSTFRQEEVRAQLTGDVR